MDRHLRANLACGLGWTAEADRVKEPMIDWKPISEAPQSPRPEETFLLWCPDLTVSGPAVVAYQINGEWVGAIDAQKLPPASFR